jgi:hypothetical protein
MIYEFTSSLEEEDEIDFLLAAEAARTQTESDNSTPDKIQVDVVSEHGTKKEFIVNRELCPTYIAHPKDEVK